MAESSGFLVAYPESGSAFSSRLWRKGAKRLVRAYWGNDVRLQECAIPLAAREDTVIQAIDAGLSVVLADSLFAHPMQGSFLTPKVSELAELPSLTNLSLPSDVDRAIEPSLAYWAFPHPPSPPESLQAATGVKGKPFRTSVVLSTNLLPPTKRNARQHAYVELMKWDLAEVLDDLVVRHVVLLSHGEPPAKDDWDLYDLVLRSRKPELVRMLPNASIEDQYAIAMGCHQVITDYPELAAAALNLGRRVLLLGAERDHPCIASLSSPNLMLVPPSSTLPGEVQQFLSVPKAPPHVRSTTVESMNTAAQLGRRILLQA